MLIRILRTALLSLLGVMFVLGLAEVGVHLWQQRPGNRDLYVPDAVLGYRFRSGRHVLDKREVHVNREGICAEEIPQNRDPNEVRILFMGDSITCGLDHQDLTVSSAVQESLGKADPGHRYRAINAGIPGYSSLQGLLLLDRLGPRYRPDVIVVTFLNNDARAKPYGPVPEDDWPLRLRGFLYESELYRLWLVAKMKRFNLHVEPYSPDPWATYDEAWAAALRTYHEKARQLGARVLYVEEALTFTDPSPGAPGRQRTLPSMPPERMEEMIAIQVRETEGRGLPLVRISKEPGFAEVLPEFYIPDDLFHPSRVGAGFMGKAMARALRSHRLVPVPKYLGPRAEPTRAAGGEAFPRQAHAVEGVSAAEEPVQHGGHMRAEDPTPLRRNRASRSVPYTVKPVDPNPMGSPPARGRSSDPPASAPSPPSDSFSQGGSVPDPTVRFKEASRRLLSSGPPGTLWTFSAGDFLRQAPMTSAAGRMYVLGNDNVLHVLDPEVGREVMRLRLDKVIGPVKTEQGSVLVLDANWDSEVNLLSGDGQSRAWKRDAVLEDVRFEPAVGRDGTFYFVTKGNRIQAVDGSQGTAGWSRKLKDAVSDTPVIGPDGTLYVNTWGGVTALDGKTGRPRWSFATDSLVDSQVALGPDGTVYAASHGGTVYALDGRTGEKRFAQKVGDFILRTPVPGPDGALYILEGHDDVVHALDQASGSERWRYRSQEAVQHQRRLTFPPAFDGEGRVYVGDSAGLVTALGTDRGQELWSHRTGAGVFGTPVVAGDGYVYAADLAGVVVALDRQSGAPTWTRDLKDTVPYPVLPGPRGIVYAATAEGQVYALEGPAYVPGPEGGGREPTIEASEGFVDIGGVRLKVRQA